MKNVWYLRFKNSIWIVPSIFTLGAIVLAAITVALDNYFFADIQSPFVEFILMEVDLAQMVLSTIAGALLTMTTITFSVIMVVLTMYSSQFSPRTLKNFITDSVTTRVMGMFIGGFVYSISSLVFMRESFENEVISALVGVIIALICLAFFVYFIHHVARSVQVNELIDDLAMDVLDTIKNCQEKIKGSDRVSLLPVPPPKPPQCSLKQDIHVDVFGYIQLIQMEDMAECAREYGCFIQLAQPIGSYLSKDKALMTVYYEDSIPENLLNMVSIGNERTTMQDVDFGLRKLAEVALRAVSPGINDPNTARECIRYLGTCLREASKLDGSYLAFYDKEDHPALSIPFRAFEELLDSSFQQLIHYGKNDISVILSIFDALADIAEDSDDNIKSKVRDFKLYVLEKVDQQSLTLSENQMLKAKKGQLEDLLD